VDPRITRITGAYHDGPSQLIAVLELRADNTCRLAIADRVEVDGRCHIRLARTAWNGKDARDTRWWSVVFDPNNKALIIRNGSCGDPVTLADVPRIVAAIESLDLAAPHTMIAIDDHPAAFPWR
jgi:hypothetical protein